MKAFKPLFVLCILLSLLCLTVSAFGQVPDEITGMRLQKSSLTLTAGQTYTFVPRISTREVSGAVNRTLHLYSSDENVVRVTDELNTIEAVGGGSAQVTVFTAGYEFSAVCTVKVRGEEKSLAPKGEPWENPADDQLAKVNDPALNAFFKTLSRPEMANTASTLAAGESFKVLVRVAEGQANAAADRMRELGMDPVYAFDRINTVSAKGTAEQFKTLLAEESILSIDEDAITFANALEPTSPLEGQAETISHFSAAYDMGLSGEGTAVAIIDCGVFPDHEQFEDRIKYGACFTQPDGEEDGLTTIASCANGEAEDLTSGWINEERVKVINYIHGTHVAGIAAGKDGVAPKADIIAVNVFTGLKYPCTIFGIEDICTDVGSLASDQIRALEYLSKLVKEEGVNLASVNMSLGGGSYSSVCAKDDREPYIKDLQDLGVITAAASGNESLDGKINIPACLPSAFAVGALWDSGTPEVANYSNHSKLVDLLAPGTSIRSAVPDGSGATDEYEVLEGTSMATPMVAGAIALLREKFPDVSAEMIKTLLTDMTDQTAARKGVTKPVLDLANLPAAAEFLDNGPSVTASGGDGFIQLTFGEVPFKVRYDLTINSIPAGAKPVKTYSGSNLKSVKISKLTNDIPYEISISYSAEGIDGTRQLILKGMAMKPISSGTIDWELPAGSEDEPAPAPVVKFGWTPEENAELVVNYAQGGVTGTVTTAEAEAEWGEAVFNETVSAAYSKRVTLDGVAYDSMPVMLETLPLGPAVPNFVDSFNGKIYLNFDEPDENLTGREIRLAEITFETDENGDYKEVIGEDIKIFRVPVKKSPVDILIKGIKTDKTFAIFVRNYVTKGKTTWTGDWYLVTYKGLFGKETKVFENAIPVYKKTHESSMKSPRIDRLDVSAGDRSVTVGYQKNLIADGYEIQVKPVEPNRKLTTFSASAAKVREGLTVNKLTNGTVYKLRVRWYVGTAKKPCFTAYFPHNGMLEQNDLWLGVYFVPMSVPNVISADEDGRFVINCDGSADKLAIVKVNGTDAADSEVLYVDVVPGENIIETGLAADERSFVLMYAKEYNEHVYYGHAAYFSPVFNDGENEMNIGYGAKSAEELPDLSTLPAFANAAQIDGVPVQGLTDLAPKALEVSEAEADAEAEVPEEAEPEAEPEIEADFYEATVYDPKPEYIPEPEEGPASETEAKALTEADTEAEPAEESVPNLSDLTIVWNSLTVLPGEHVIMGE